MVTLQETGLENATQQMSVLTLPKMPTVPLQSVEVP